MIDEFTKYLARLEEQWVEEKPIRLELRDGKNKNCFDACINKYHVTLSQFSAVHFGVGNFMSHTWWTKLGEKLDLEL